LYTVLKRRWDMKPLKHIENEEAIPVFPGSWYGFYSHENLTLPLFNGRISAGFPAPSDDYLESRIDLNKQLISHPSATFFVRVRGNSMIDAGINDGDMLIVDRALDARNNDIVVSVIDGEFTVKRLRKEKNEILLIPENPAFLPIRISPDHDFKIWGVVSYVIHKTR
jgi:DNA polymerase V